VSLLHLSLHTCYSCKGKKPHKVADYFAKWAKMGVKQQISFLKSCFLLDEADRIEVMQSYIDEIEVFICILSPTTSPLPSYTDYYTISLYPIARQIALIKTIRLVKLCHGRVNT
jgi:hypothetical protein